MDSVTRDLSETRAELARRHRVDHSAVARALTAAQRRHDADPDHHPPPPQPVNPGHPQPRYQPAEFDPWWQARPRRGRPARTTTAPPPEETVR